MEVITNFIHSILPDVEVIYEENEFWVDIENEVINIGINPDPLGNKLIQEFVLNEFGVSMDPLLIGVLHEVYHIITYDEEISKKDRILCKLFTMNYNPTRVREYSLMYFNLPSEYKATEGAVNYYLTHKEYCDEFLRSLNYEA